MIKRRVTCEGQVYEVLLVAEDGGGFSASVPAFPGAYSDGDTESEALENIVDAIAILKESAVEVDELLRQHENASQSGSEVVAD